MGTHWNYIPEVIQWVPVSNVLMHIINFIIPDEDFFRTEKQNNRKIFSSQKLRMLVLIRSAYSDLDLHCLPLSMQIYSNNLDQVV